MRPQNARRRAARQIRWGEKGRTGVILVDVSLPHQEYGKLTRRLYVWQPSSWPVWVDVRDVPGLIEAVGLEHLTGNYIDELKAKKAAHDKRKAKEQEQAREPAEIEEVEQ